jgi:hypothetical protein
MTLNPCPQITQIDYRAEARPARAAFLQVGLQSDTVDAASPDRAGSTWMLICDNLHNLRVNDLNE